QQGPEASLDQQPAASAPETPAGKAATQESDVKTTAKTTERRKPKKPGAEKKAAQKAARKPAAKIADVREGSKLEKIVGLLTRPEGCTTKDVLKATGWPSVSMPQQAEAAGI